MNARDPESGLHPVLGESEPEISVLIVDSDETYSRQLAAALAVEGLGSAANRGLRLGAFDYFVKPHDAQSLVRTIRQLSWGKRGDPRFGTGGEHHAAGSG